MSSKMIHCKACGKEISAKAPSCPGCGAKNKKPFYFWRLAFCFCPASLVGGIAFRLHFITHTRVYIYYNVWLGVLSAPLGRARKKNDEAPSRKMTSAALAAQQPPQQFGEAWRRLPPCGRRSVRWHGGACRPAGGHN